MIWRIRIVGVVVILVRIVDVGIINIDWVGIVETWVGVVDKDWIGVIEAGVGIVKTGVGGIEARIWCVEARIVHSARWRWWWSSIVGEEWLVCEFWIRVI